MGRVLEISGMPKNVQTAGRVAVLIAGVARREWQVAEIGRGARFDDFVLGIVEGFRTRLESNAPAPGGEAQAGRALQKAFDPGLRDYGRKRYGRLVHRSGTASRTDVRSLEAGRRVGRTIIVSEDTVDRIASTARLPLRLPSGGRPSSTD